VAFSSSGHSGRSAGSGASPSSSRRADYGVCDGASHGSQTTGTWKGPIWSLSFSFAERLIHAASANYFFINSALGQKLPGDEDTPRAQFKNKAAIVAYAKKSFADGAAAIKSKGDGGISDLVVDPFGYDDPQHAGKAQIRLSDLAHNLIEHSGEVYGQLSVYYRVAG
jgi:hypothetical protein